MYLYKRRFSFMHTTHKCLEHISKLIKGFQAFPLQREFQHMSGLPSKTFVCVLVSVWRNMQLKTPSNKHKLNLTTIWIRG